MDSVLKYEADYKAISLLTAEQAHTFRVVPWKCEDETITFLESDAHEGLSGKLHLLTGKTIELVNIPGEDLERYLHSWYPQKNTVAEKNKQRSKSSSDIVRFVNRVFQDAVNMGASDIHIERYESSARIRFRWEGQLIEKYEIEKVQYDSIISRVKILAELDIAEKRLPQDGRIQIKIPDAASIDIRVSTLPGKYGEKVVLRLLTRSEKHLNISHLGFQSQEQTAFEEAINTPNGIILITGPTGSGKTTTLYAALNRLNTPGKNILTIEDPIEYNLEGIHQVQTKEEIGLSFDRALRAFLRQDPDVIMVGEIRDSQTAQIAIRAALTGHLVFSTLHTNHSWDAITRLIDMGIESYLLSSALRLVLAQRLIRILCPHCKQAYEPSFSDKQDFNSELKMAFRPIGCKECHYTGYQGRKAVFELMPVTREIRDGIRHFQYQEKPALHNSGFATLNQNLLSLVKAGQTSIEEMLVHYQ